MHILNVEMFSAQLVFYLAITIRIVSVYNDELLKSFGMICDFR